MPVSVHFITTSDPLFGQAAALRYHVLHRPLGLPEQDLDDADAASRHLVAERDGRVLGYARVVTSDRALRIRHVAVDTTERGHGIGRMLVDAAVAQARREMRSLVWVNARFTAIGFWQHLGFRPAGELTQAEDTHLPHKRMELQVG